MQTVAAVGPWLCLDDYIHSLFVKVKLGQMSVFSEHSFSELRTVLVLALREGSQFMTPSSKMLGAVCALNFKRQSSSPRGE